MHQRRGDDGGPGHLTSPPDSVALWHRALADAGRRPVRVVVVADSIGELSGGFRAVWGRFHRHVTADPPGAWEPPRKLDGAHPWPLLPGEPAPIGLEARGQVLAAGDGPAGVVAPVPVPTTVDLYYTARPDGAPLEVRLDGTTVATVDTSRDERGEPVAAPLAAQRWRSPEVAGASAWQVEAVGAGVAAVEAVCTPPATGLEVHGTGRSGVPTADVLAGGQAIGHLAAMAARGEPPDLVVWAADTADVAFARHQGAPTAEALDRTRAILPSSALAHYVPSGRSGLPDWPEAAARYRAIASARGAITIDGFAALGDVSRGAPEAHLGRDGIHLTHAGEALLVDAWVDALRPPGVPRLVPTSPWHRALAASATGGRPARAVLVTDDAGDRSPGLDAVRDTLRRDAATADVVARGAVLDHLAVMAARGEPPDLVVWAAETGAESDLVTTMAGVTTALDRARELAPRAAIVLEVPDPDGDPELVRRAEVYRAIAHLRDVAVLEAAELSGAGPPERGRRAWTALLEPPRR